LERIFRYNFSNANWRDAGSCGDIGCGDCAICKHASIREPVNYQRAEHCGHERNAERIGQAEMTGRSVPEWVGKTPDAKVPERVRQRIFKRHDGICHICGGPIQGKAWDADHVKALDDNGEHRESNLAPAHKPCHLGKTAKENSTRAKAKRIEQKHTGARRPKGSIKSRGFNPVEKAEKTGKAKLPPRPLFKVQE
jgi:5-methylcytosine-specific restriction enzyme A